jgi:Flp pilus assembly pilin Flp
MSRVSPALTGTIREAGSILRRDEGQTLVEYTLILMLIVVLAVVLLTTMGHTVSTMISKATDAF